MGARAIAVACEAAVMRFVVDGAGAVGGVLGGRLAQHGHDVTLIARGPHLDAIRARGLRVEDPDDAVVLRLPCVASPAELDVGAEDVVLLAMKTQDTTAALEALAAAAAPPTPVVCVQNAVVNETTALRRFANVYGVAVMLPTQFLEPGVVQAYSTPTTGILDIGPVPGGHVDELATAIAAAFTESRLASVARPDIMAWKYRKLITNLGNAIEAVCGPDARGGRLGDIVAAEGEACLDAAGVDRVSVEEDQERRGDLIRWRPIGGVRRGGGSSWQSLVRGTGAIETDYLNGEIVLLGRRHGVPTPANATLQRLARTLAHTGGRPGSVTEDEVLELAIDC